MLPSLGNVAEDLLEPCQNPENRHLLAEFVEHVESFQRGFQELSSSVDNVSTLLDGMSTAGLSGAFECLRRWGLEGHSFSEIRDLLSNCEDTKDFLHDADSAFRVLLNVVGCNAPATLS